MHAKGKNIDTSSLNILIFEKLIFLFNNIAYCQMNCSLYQKLNIKLITYNTTELICSFVLEDLSYKKPGN